MNPTLTKKLDKFKALRDMKVQFDAMNEDGDDLGAGFQGPSSLALLRSIPDCVESEGEAELVVQMLMSGRAGHIAPSIGVDHQPVEVDVEETPVKLAIARPAAMPVFLVKAPAASPVVELQVTDEATRIDPPEYAQMFGRGKRPAQNEQPTGGTAWAEWTDPVGTGALPEGLDNDDAIAYRMKDGSVLCTDYPYDLNWIHEGEPSDIVAYRLLAVDEVKDMLPWNEWHGGDECPVDPSAMIQVRLFNYGHNEAINAGLQHWKHHAKTHHNHDVNIVAYRLVTP